MKQKERQPDLKRGKILGIFLVLSMLLMATGCGADESGKQTLEDKVLVANYQQITADDGLLELTGLLSEKYAYIAGVRQTAEAAGMETAIYRMDKEAKDAELIAAYPDEKILQWCAGENGQIAILGLKMTGDDASVKEYVLHLIEEESLSEQSCILKNNTDLTRNIVMALREGEVAVADSMAGEVLFFDSATGAQINTISAEDTPLYLAYQEDKLAGVSGSGALYLYNPKTGSREKTAEGLYGQTGPVKYCTISEKEVLLATGSGLYAVTVKDLVCTQVADYVEYDILPGDGFIVTADAAQGRYQILTWNNEEGRGEVCRLQSVSKEEAEAVQKEVILLSVYTRDPGLQAAVVAFNKSSDKYRVEIEWGEESSDYTGYWNILWTELMTGGGPDLLNVSSQMNFNDYIRQGMLEDLAPYIEANLEADDYVDSALYAYRQGDSVYGLESSFRLAALITKQSLLAESGADFEAESRMGWTFEEMAAAAAANPQIKVYKENAEPMEVLRDCLAFGGVDYSDYETLSQAILFAEQYGKSLEPGETAVLGENVLVADISLHTPLGWADVQALYGEDIVVAGYPRSDRQGVKHEGSALSINSNSVHKEGAWAFLQFLLSRDYQENRAGGFSVCEDIFKRELMAYAEPDSYQLYLPEAGGIVTVTNTYRLPASGLEIDAMTQEQTEEVRSLAENSMIYEFTADYGAWNIIYEEAGSYFSGDKSLEEVMEALQNRMGVYLDEKGGY